MTININGHSAQGEALPKIGKHNLSPLQIKVNFDALVAVQTGSEG